MATGNGSTGAVGLSLDAAIRQQAITAGRGPRDPSIANTALVGIAVKYDYCQSWADGPFTPSDTCTLKLQGINLAHDYQQTGRITLQPPPFQYQDQTVGLTVAANPRVAGRLTIGGCPK